MEKIYYNIILIKNRGVLMLREITIFLFNNVLYVYNKYNIYYILQRNIACNYLNILMHK